MSLDAINKQQRIMLEYIFSDHKLFATTNSILKPEYFDPPLRTVVEFVKEHYRVYKDIPQMDIIDAKLDVKLEARICSDKNRQALAEDIETYCLYESVKNFIIDASNRITDEENLNMMSLVRDLKDAANVSIRRDLGVKLKDSVKERIEETHSAKMFSTGLKTIDKIIGKIRQTDFGMVYGGSGAGKSLMLAALAIALARQGATCVIFSLELTQNLYAMRMDSMMSGVAISDHQLMVNQIEDFYANSGGEFADIYIKKLKGKSTVADIEQYLMDFIMETGINPDFILVDYLGLMGVDNYRGDNKFDQDDEKSVGLIALKDEYGCGVIGAGQLNRDSYGILDLQPKHCAGGLSVINNSDWAFGLVATDEDIENDQVQVRGLKVRHAAKLTSKDLAPLYRDPRTLMMRDLDINETRSYFADQQTKANNGKTKGDKPAFKKATLREDPDKKETSTKAKPLKRRGPLTPDQLFG